MTTSSGPIPYRSARSARRGAGLKRSRSRAGHFDRDPVRVGALAVAVVRQCLVVGGHCGAAANHRTLGDADQLGQPGVAQRVGHVDGPEQHRYPEVPARLQPNRLPAVGGNAVEHDGVEVPVTQRVIDRRNLGDGGHEGGPAVVVEPGPASEPPPLSPGCARLEPTATSVRR